MASDFRNIRTDYEGDALPDDLATIDPWAMFETWLQEAVDAAGHEPTAMVLSTANSSGMPDARIVLLKEVDDCALVFYTDFTSGKGTQMDANPQAHALFFWPEPMRQVRMQGRVERVDAGRSREYFDSRPHPSKVAAVASEQSFVLESRTALKQAFADAARRYPDDVPMPERWGGYRLVVNQIELWQGLPSRLHDRARFTRRDGGWDATRLQP